MKSNLTLLALTALAIVALGGAETKLAAARPNVLFIAVDDLRTELGCDGALQF